MQTTSAHRPGLVPMPSATPGRRCVVISCSASFRSKTAAKGCKRSILDQSAYQRYSLDFSDECTAVEHVFVIHDLAAVVACNLEKRDTDGQWAP